jgi:small-conductance mechanosensitive channel
MYATIEDQREVQRMMKQTLDLVEKLMDKYCQLDLEVQELKQQLGNVAKIAHSADAMWRPLG